MSKIEVLDAHVADLIAAGEVVERPASAVKELMENAIDAGATAITVELRGGGTALIRVTDNGCGMTAEDAGVAFLRHATSKLRHERDLEAIGTLGFRGEALAAISAVSRVKLLSRTKESSEGVCVTLDAGIMQDISPAGSPVGTTMEIRDLFYNTPARRKFLKTDRSEGAACVQTALRVALGRPDLSIRCIRDGTEEFFTPGDGNALSCIYSLLGRDTAASLLPLSGENEGLCVSGFLSRPTAARGNRAQQHFYVNGRYIRSRSLQTAVEQAYKNTLMTGRYPSCVIYLTVSPAFVDVNVHPTKSEVKFSDERKVFDGVYYAALSALTPKPIAAEEEPAPAFSPKVPQKPAVSAPLPSKPMPKKAETVQDAIAPWQTLFDRPTQEETAWKELKEELPAPPVFRFCNYGTDGKPSTPPEPAQEPVSHEKKLPAPVPAPTPAPMAPVSMPTPAPEQPFRLIGEAMKTYVLVEYGEKLLLIDKHAAHERLIFDRLRANDMPPMSQMLLLPVTLTPGTEGMELLRENGETLEALGFEIEPYGEHSVALRAIPADISPEDARATVEEILARLAEGSAAGGQDARDAILHSIACKAAIKAGKTSEPKELEALARRVIAGEAAYCPHGRPVSVTLSKKELDKLFGRLG